MLGDNIKMLRNEKGLSQVEFSKVLNVSASTIAMWETNKRDPDTEMLIKIANFFNVSTDYLLGINALRNNKQATVFSGTKTLPNEDVEFVQHVINHLNKKNK